MSSSPLAESISLMFHLEQHKQKKKQDIIPDLTSTEPKHLHLMGSTDCQAAEICMQPPAEALTPSPINGFEFVK